MNASVNDSRRKERLMNVLIAPHMSEKSTIVADAHNQIAFRVRRDATKEEIRQAVELLFEVEVHDVTVVNCRGKVKRHAFQYGQRSAWKKAYVKVAPGSQIDFLGVE
ncbi:MAG TPA: 50S ribosomal protein L23 [Woeseiaceae bacterium]|nr:50S ribosomal protein L23 [Woeseiaceae bacterium]